MPVLLASLTASSKSKSFRERFVVSGLSTLTTFSGWTFKSSVLLESPILVLEDLSKEEWAKIHKMEKLLAVAKSINNILAKDGATEVGK